VQSDGARRALDIHFTPQGAATLAAISPELRGEPLVFVLDGELLIAPIVGSRLSERLGIELPAAMSERATALARAIAASNFASPPTPIEVSAQCERPR
jgi:preprotein translocase subunit SecD